MASSRTWRYSVFPSCHGQDIRKALIFHLRKKFNLNGIVRFDGQGIERSQTIALTLIGEIRESRISILVLSNNYASSSWCLNELVEIMKCKNLIISYQVDPSDVRKQTGDFGKAFPKTCAGKTKEEKQEMDPSFGLCGQHSWRTLAKLGK